MCSCSAHGPRCAMRLSRCSLSWRSAMVLAGWILSWANPPAGRRATEVHMACKGSPDMGEAHHPDHPGSCRSCLPERESRSTTSAMSRVSYQTHHWQSKSRRFQALRHGRWVHTVGQRCTIRARQNLPLNLLVDRATMRACSMHLPDHPLTVNLICTARLISTRTL